MHSSSVSKHLAAVALFAALISGPAFGEKPSWAGSGENNSNGKGKSASSAKAKGGNDSNGITINAYFGDRHRSAVSDFYRTEFRAGHCPPGLAKKQNGCMPPGQAKKWGVGRPLPGDVVIYDLPRELVIRLGAPPAGHKFVRVAADILLIAVGTNMVVDALEDLSSL